MKRARSLHSNETQSMGWKFWLTVAFVFPTLSLTHVFAGMIASHGHVGEPASATPWEEPLALVMYLMLGAMSFAFSIHAMLIDPNHDLPEPDRELYDKFGMIVSGVLLVILAACCRGDLQHTVDLWSAVLSCITRLAKGVGLILCFHVMNRMFFRRLSAYLRQRAGQPPHLAL